MKRILLAAGILAMTAAPTLAADPILIIEEMTASGFDWNGPYAGFTVGYGSGGATTVGDVNGSIDNIPVAGALAGVTLGVNMQNGSFVLGAEGDISWSGMTGTVACAAAPAFACNGSIGWMGSVRARAGFAADRVLVYATAGLAVANATGTITPTFPGTTSVYNATYVGWTVGAGAEVAVADTMSVKAEYTFSNLGSSVAPVGTLGVIQSYTISPFVHAAKIGLNFHF